MMYALSFKIIYKKGEELPADFLSRNVVQCLAREKDKDEILRSLKLYLLINCYLKITKSSIWFTKCGTSIFP
jgi:hypothetical protein